VSPLLGLLLEYKYVQAFELLQKKEGPSLMIFRKLAAKVELLIVLDTSYTFESSFG